MKMTFKKQILSVLATGAILLNATLPVFADTTLVISGNGADSKNDTKLDLQQTQTVVQSNTADVKNYVNADASSGGNTADKNTGGNVSIDTGDASTGVTVQNTLNSNEASLNCCGAGDIGVLISGNGADTKNTADLKIDHSTLVGQTNNADVKNIVRAGSETGDNTADKNTGGNVSIKTGDADTTVDVSTTANANSAQVGGGIGSGGGSLSLRILGNGYKSKNDIKLDLDKSMNLVQNNKADVSNNVDADAKSGDNKANENTGGNVSIDTGDASVDVSVDNMVNFNWADVDCGCLLDLLAKVADNGANTQNKIDAKLADNLVVFQDNCGDEQNREGKCQVKSDVYADASSGDNKVEKGTGNHNGDPSIQTGDASSEVSVDNAGNSNVFGHVPSVDWPDLSGFNLNITLNLSDLLHFLGL